MASSDVYICNMALRSLGLNSISTLEEPHTTQAQRDCSLFYQQAVSDVLSKAPWIFARKRRALASYTVPELYEDQYAYCYVFPVDCARLLKVLVPDSEKKIDYLVMRSATNEKIILCNTENAVAEYTMMVSDPTWFDSLFSEAVAMRLASFLAEPLRASEAKTQLAAQRYQIVIGEALKFNRVQDQKPKTKGVPWIEARTK